MLHSPKLFRGVSLLDSIELVDTANLPQRNSRNTSNWYTLAINSFDEWLDYPRRMLICTTNKHYAEEFGEIAVVIPKKSTKIGICEDSDIWNSRAMSIKWDASPSKLPKTLDTLNKKISQFFNSIYYKARSFYIFYKYKHS